MPHTSATQSVDVDGHRLRLSNLDKVLYPASGTTKREVLEYYATIAPVMLPHIAFRPATRKRWPDGVGTAQHPGSSFFQKALEASAPEWVARAEIAHRDHVNTYPLVNDLATLVWCAQQSALELHVPQWQFQRDGRRGDPDRLVLDLDPGEGVGLAECVVVARFARSILQHMGLDPVPVTSGSKGLHLYAHVERTASADQLSAVAHELARALEADHPDLVVSEMRTALRAGKVFVDWSQNNGAKTTIAPYSLRGRERPWVAAPRTWAELASPHLRQLELGDVLERVRRRGDPLSPVIDDETRRRMPLQVDASLEAYRAKRDPARTPEPVPAGGTVVWHDGASPRFVIHEHHARRRHFDLRLERDGVLESWAVPKGVPDDPAQNRLAVQTEPHPLEYAEFAGTIPAGEYGAGEMHIWDSGEVEVEKWRDDEILVTLHGRTGGGLGGSARFALIRTGGAGEQSTWLLHRRRPEASGGGQAGGRPQRRRHSGDADAGPGPGPAPRSAGTTPARTATASADGGPGRYRPMLATLSTAAALDPDTDWAIELKWDGMRVAVTVDQGAVRLRSRNERDITADFPEFTELASRVAAASAVLDGEIVALDRTGRPDFGLLQQRLGLTRPADVRAAVTRVPTALYLFDVLEIDGRVLTDEPYRARRRALEALVRPVPGVLEVPPAFEGDAAAGIRASRRLGLEGVVAKDMASRYEPGRRSRAWLKIKHVATQAVVIVGWRPGRGERTGSLGSLLLAVPREGAAPAGQLRYVGRVGTGFDAAERERLLRLLAPLQRPAPEVADLPPADAVDAVWVRPEVVGEVRFGEWTAGGRLRHPVWRGLRPDTAPADVTVEQPRP